MTVVKTAEPPRVVARRLLEEAQAEMRRDQYRKAIDLLHKAFKITTSRRLLPQIIVELAGAHAAAEDITGFCYYARVFFSTLKDEERNPYMAKMQFHLAEVDELNQRWEKAAGAYRGALVDSSSVLPSLDRGLTILRLAFCLIRTPQVEEGARLLALLRNTPGLKVSEGELLFVEAFLALVRNDYHAAIRLATQALRRRDTSSKTKCRACTILADAHQDLLQWSEARDWLEEAAIHAHVANSDSLLTDVMTRLDVLSNEQKSVSSSPTWFSGRG